MSEAEPSPPGVSYTGYGRYVVQPGVAVESWSTRLPGGVERGDRAGRGSWARGVKLKWATRRRAFEPKLGITDNHKGARVVVGRAAWELLAVPADAAAPETWAIRPQPRPRPELSVPAYLQQTPRAQPARRAGAAEALSAPAEPPPHRTHAGAAFWAAAVAAARACGAFKTALFRARAVRTLRQLFLPVVKRRVHFRLARRFKKLVPRLAPTDFRKHAFFDELPGGLLPRLQAEQTSFATGETLFAAGDPSAFVYVVQKGTVVLYTGAAGDAPKGERIEAAGEGGVVGDPLLRDKQPHTATAVAGSPCVLIAIRLDHLEAVWSVLPGDARAAMEAVSFASRAKRLVAEGVPDAALRSARFFSVVLEGVPATRHRTRVHDGRRVLGAPQFLRAVAGLMTPSSLPPNRRLVAADGPAAQFIYLANGTVVKSASHSTESDSDEEEAADHDGLMAAALEGFEQHPALLLRKCVRAVVESSKEKHLSASAAPEAEPELAEHVNRARRSSAVSFFTVFAREYGPQRDRQPLDKHKWLQTCSLLSNIKLLKRLLRKLMTEATASLQATPAKTTTHGHKLAQSIVSTGQRIRHSGWLVDSPLCFFEKEGRPAGASYHTESAVDIWTLDPKALASFLKSPAANGQLPAQSPTRRADPGSPPSSARAGERGVPGLVESPGGSVVGSPRGGGLRPAPAAAGCGGVAKPGIAVLRAIRAMVVVRDEAIHDTIAAYVRLTAAHGCYAAAAAEARPA
eukprot:gene17672-27194_t